MIVGALRILNQRWFVTPLLTLFALSMLTLGCGGLDVDGYPEDFEYPARTSPLVKEGKKALELKATVDSYPKLGAMPQANFAQYAKDADEHLVEMAKIPEDQRERLNVALRSLFGTPAKPTVIPYFDSSRGTALRSGLDAGKKTTAVLVKLFGTDDNKLADLLPSSGSPDYRRVWKRVERDILPSGSVLYRRHCLHCHGVTGNGRGPTAPWVKPHPRDYRQGRFKFTSTLPKNKPLRADLYRTLYHGLEGTSMPPFKHLTSKELNELVSYVIHLSIRGEVERTVLEALSANPDPKADVWVLVGKALPNVVDGWTNAKPLPVLPYEQTTVYRQLQEDPKKKAEILKASIGRGYKVFIAGGCLSCHYNYGRTDNFRLDSWGTVVRPRNLVQGKFRGGRRPIDVYYRVVAGIDPSGMPQAYKDDVEDLISQGTFPPPTQIYNPRNPDNVWDLVNFVRALPFPHMLPDDVHKAIYGHGQ